MARRNGSVKIPRDLVTELLESSIRFQEVAETLEVQLDKPTVRRLKKGEMEYRKGNFKIARTKDEIHRILSS